METQADLAVDTTITKVSATEVEISKVIPEQVVTERLSLNDIEDKIKTKQADINYYSNEKTKNEGAIAQIQANIDSLQIELDELVSLKTQAEKTGIIKE